MPTLDFDGVTLHYTDEGAGEPVILVHGFPHSSDLWLPQRAALSSRYRVIAPDLRGFGRSDVPHGAIPIDLYADDIVGMMDMLGIGTATIGGLSMGGYVLMALLRRHPERVRGVVLMSTKATADTETGKQGRNEMIAIAQNEGVSAIAERMLPRMLASRTQADDPELVDFIRQMMAAPPVEGVVGALYAMRDRPDSREILEQTHLPALVLAGLEDEITLLPDAEVMHTALRGSRLVPIAGASHLLNVEQPDLVNSELLTFLEGL